MPSFKRLYPFLLLITLVASACQPIQPAAPVAMVSAPAMPWPTTNTTVPRFMRTACLYRIPPASGWLTYASAQQIPASRLLFANVYGIYYSIMCNYAAGLAATAEQETTPDASCGEGGTETQRCRMGIFGELCGFASDF